jgi:hypothetical protein
MNELGRCEGDCDLYNDCGEDLVCFQRSSATTTLIPGCKNNPDPGVPEPLGFADFCVLGTGR